MGTAAGLLYLAGHYAGILPKAFDPNSDRAATPPSMPPLSANPMVTKKVVGHAGDGVKSEAELYGSYGVRPMPHDEPERDILGMPVGVPLDDYLRKKRPGAGTAISGSRPVDGRSVEWPPVSGAGDV